jgi:DNA-binding IscR family transcriptional regulator
LLRPAEDVSLAELLISLEDGFQLANCNSHVHGEGGDDECTVLHICPIRGPIGELHRRILDSLRAVSIAELFQSSAPAPAFQPVLSTLTLREACAGAAAE